MSDSFLEDIEYLGKVILITLILLSLMVIYNNKVFEGIILLTFAIQIILIWILSKKYELRDLLDSIASTSAANRAKRYGHLVLLSILFVVALSYIFRAIIIAQESINNFGLISSSYHQDIMFAMVLGVLFFIIFTITYIVGRKIFSNNNQQLAVPAVLFGVLFLMLNTHIFHNF